MVISLPILTCMSASTSQGYGQCLVLNRCAREASNPEQGSDKGKKNENIDMDMGKNINAKFKSILAFLLPEKIGKGTFPIGHFPDEDFYQENNHHLYRNHDQNYTIFRMKKSMRRR